jgi:hypothetical protein
MPRVILSRWRLFLRSCCKALRKLPPARRTCVWLALLGFASTDVGWTQTLQLSPADILQRARPGSIPVTPSPATEATAPAPASPPPAAAPGPVFAVAQAYLYLEPHQARFEVLYDAATALRILDPGREPPAVIDRAARQRLAKDMAAHAEAWCRLHTEDGREAARSMAHPVLLSGKPGATQPVEDVPELPLAGALLGLAWSFELPPMPEQVTVAWRGYLPESGKLPVGVLFGSRSEPAEIDRSTSSLTWHSHGRLPRPQPLVAVPGTATASLNLPVGFLLWACVGAALAWSFHRRRTRLFGGWLLYAILWGVGAIILWPRFVLPVAPRGGPEVDQPEGAAAVLSPLLQNVYRAFDHRSESAIYDVLDRSVDGDLLRRLYLETIEALSLEGREGARVTINEFSAEVDAVQAVGQGFLADCQWTALGTVGHWGHAHTRVNRYKARVTVTAVRGEWKLTGLEVLEARRL